MATRWSSPIAAVDSAGDPPSVTYIDVASHRLLDRVPLTDARLDTGHLGIAQDRSLVVVSAPRAGPSTAERGGEMETQPMIAPSYM